MSRSYKAHLWKGRSAFYGCLLEAPDRILGPWPTAEAGRDGLESLLEV